MPSGVWEALLSQGVLGALVVLESIAIGWLATRLLACMKERSCEKIELLEKSLESQKQVLDAVSAIQISLDGFIDRMSERTRLENKLQELLIEVKSSGKRE